MNSPEFLDWRTCSSCGEEYHRAAGPDCDCGEGSPRPEVRLSAAELAESEAAIDAFVAELAAESAREAS
jgi:hypothetical protein